MYLLDANILIDAKNRYYAFDIAPGFWAWLECGHRAGQLISIDAVRGELLQGDDELAEWARNHGGFFRPADHRTVQHFGRLSVWAQNQNYKQSALHEFSADQADFLLVAEALGHGDTVITNEKSNPNARNRVKIPDACVAMEVETADIFTVLRRAGAELHLLGGEDESIDNGSATPTIPGLMC